MLSEGTTILAEDFKVAGFKLEGFKKTQMAGLLKQAKGNLKELMNTKNFPPKFPFLFFKKLKAMAVAVLKNETPVSFSDKKVLEMILAMTLNIEQGFINLKEFVKFQKTILEKMPPQAQDSSEDQNATAIPTINTSQHEIIDVDSDDPVPRTEPPAGYTPTLYETFWESQYVTLYDNYMTLVAKERLANQIAMDSMILADKLRQDNSNYRLKNSTLSMEVELLKDEVDSLIVEKVSLSKQLLKKYRNVKANREENESCQHAFSLQILGALREKCPTEYRDVMNSCSFVAERQANKNLKRDLNNKLKDIQKEKVTGKSSSMESNLMAIDQK